MINAKTMQASIGNLLRDPKTRDLAISRAKLVERTRQAKIDEVVDTAIATLLLRRAGEQDGRLQTKRCVS